MICDIKKKNAVINKLELKLNFAFLIIPFLKNIPNPYEFKELDYMRLKFIKYSLRAIFFLKKYNYELKRIYKKIEKEKGFNKKLRMRINDDIYHYYDAAIVFSKSITEKDKIIKPTIISNQQIQKILLKKMSLWKNQIDEMYLPDIRNEIVHLNNYGTSLDSWVQTDDSSHSFKLLSFLNESNYDINDFFDQTFNLIVTIIDEIAGIIVSEYIYLYDTESTGKTFIINKKKIKLDDLKLYS